MQVLLATEAELAAIRAIENCAILESAAHFGSEPLTVEEVHAGFHADRARYPWLVASEGGQVLGFARGCGHKGRCAYRFAVETTIYVDPRHHGRGIGRALYGELIPLLRAQGFHTALGIIALPNPASVALHEGFGYRHVGTIHEAGWKLETWHDVGTWELFLRSPGEAPAPLRSVAEVAAESSLSPTAGGSPGTPADLRTRPS